MAPRQHVSDSESDSSANSSESQAVAKKNTPAPEEDSHNRSPPHSALSHRFRNSPSTSQAVRDGSIVAVVVPPPINPWEYQPFTGDTTVDSILEVFEDSDGVRHYKIEYEDGKQEEVSDNFDLVRYALLFKEVSGEHIRTRVCICALPKLVNFARMTVRGIDEQYDRETTCSSCFLLETPVYFLRLRR